MAEKLPYFTSVIQNFDNYSIIQNTIKTALENPNNWTWQENAFCAMSIKHFI